MDNSTPGMSDLLVRYLDNELSDEEKLRVEEELSQNKDLFREYSELKESRRAIRLYGIKEKVTSVRNEMLKEEPSKVVPMGGRRRLIRMISAAAVIAVVVTGGIMGYNFYRLSVERVYSENYIPFDLATARAGQPDAYTNLEWNFSEENYDSVVAIKPSTPFSTKEKLLRGVSYLELRSYNEAIREFKEILTEEAMPGVVSWQEDAEFYLALAYIRNQDFDYAIEILQKINNNPDHLYHGQVSNRMIKRVKLLKWR